MTGLGRSRSPLWPKFCQPKVLLHGGTPGSEQSSQNHHMRSKICWSLFGRQFTISKLSALAACSYDGHFLSETTAIGPATRCPGLAGRQIWVFQHSRANDAASCDEPFHRGIRRRLSKVNIGSCAYLTPGHKAFCHSMTDFYYLSVGFAKIIVFWHDWFVSLWIVNKFLTCQSYPIGWRRHLGVV